MNGVAHAYRSCPSMSRLPSPPRFTLPPPPMPSFDIFDKEMISQLTCASIRQPYQQTWTTARLCLLGAASTLVVLLLLTITFIGLLSIRKRKRSSSEKQHVRSSQPSTNHLSRDSSRSYETISSDRTGAYLESVNTSATSCSMNTTSGHCPDCHRHYHHQPAPYYHILNVPDVVPN